MESNLSRVNFFNQTFNVIGYERDLLSFMLKPNCQTRFELKEKEYLEITRSVRKFTSSSFVDQP